MPTPEPLFVVVTGPPAAGKSTIAVPLACHLGLPLVAKDVIKEALMDVLPVPDVIASRELGRASVEVLLRVASHCPKGAVLDCNFHRTAATGRVGDLPGALVEVFCRCDVTEARRRYRARAGSRHRGHFDHQRTDDLWTSETTEPLAGGWPVLEVDTTTAVDIDHVLAHVRAITTGD